MTLIKLSILTNPKFLVYALSLCYLLVGMNGEVYGQCPTTDTYTSGSNTFTVPAGVTSITVEAWGGGGRGGYWDSNGTGGRGGGGGGGYSRSVISVSSGQSYTYVVGAGSNSDAAGENSRFYITTGPGPNLVLANGGNSAINSSTGAAGGLASTVGGFNRSGGAGANGSGTTYGGGGGSSGGTVLNGVNATNQNGAIAPTGGGNGGTGRSGSEGDGGAGTIPGGGGGGSLKTNNGSGTRSGGVGANGQIKITYTLPANTVTTTNPSQTRCINTALTPNITHTTTGATGISNSGVSGANGLPAGVSATWSGNTITITGTPTASGTFNYSIPMTGGCTIGQLPATGTITVTPNQTVGAASSTPTLCINTGLVANITHATTNSTGIANNGVAGANGLPAGVSASWVGNTITISGTPTASGTFNYSIPVIGCLASGVIATGTITVTPNNTVGAASSTPTLCINTALTNITHSTTGATGIGVATGLPAGVSAAWSGNVITISGTPTASGTFNYSIPLTGGCNTPAVNATGTITVTPNNTVAAASSTPTLCINTALTNITHATVGATGIGAATGLPAGVSAAWSGNVITISGTPTASGTFNYSIPLSGGCNTPAVNATG
ncbi:beta strand repeat-containing protein, partial [Algoriphagus ratkowskyi]